MKRRNHGFSLIEVLVALSILAIALTAILKTNSQSIHASQVIRDKTLSHWVAMQGISMVQLGLLPLYPGKEVTELTSILDQKWYWRAKVEPTELRNVQKITVRVAAKSAGPFGNPLYAFWYTP